MTDQSTARRLRRPAPDAGRPKPRPCACARSRACGAGRSSSLTGVTIFLCINQQFALRFFVGFTQLNTEYFYLLILCMLPFTFLIFPGSPKASLDADRLVRRRAVRRHRGRVVLPHDQHPRGRRARLGVRRSAAADHLGGLRDVVRAAGGAAPHRRLEPDAVRVPLHCLSAVRRRHRGSARSRATSRRSTRRPPITCCRPRACSASRSRPSPTW